MKKNNYYFIIGTIIVIGLTIVSADNPKPIDPKEKELNDLLKKSEQTRKKVNVLIKRIDEVATTEVVDMKENIKTLEQEKQTLEETLEQEKQEKENLKIELNEKNNIKFDTIPTSPFKLEPIVPLSKD